MVEECGIPGFFRRLLYKLSGAKIISVLVSSLLIIALYHLKHHYTNVSDPVTLACIAAVRDICIGLLVAKTGQNIVGMIKGVTGGNGNGS